MEGNGYPTQPTLYKQWAGFFNFPQHFKIKNTNCETGLMVFFFVIPRRLESLTFADDRKKGSTSRQLHKDPDPELVRPGFETPASGSVDRCLPTWPGCLNIG